MIFRQLFDTESSTYTYLLADAGEGVIIDPVKKHLARDLKLIKELNIKLKFILETHIHADHISGAADLQEATLAEIGVSKNSGAKASLLLNDNDQLTLGNTKIKVIATPGHTNGCLSYYVDGKLFTGDSLMIRGTGRTDFQEGSAELLYESILKLFSYPEGTLVYPAHNYNGILNSTIGEEKTHNLRLAAKSKAEFVEIMNNLNLPEPKLIKIAVPANLNFGAFINIDQLRNIQDNLPENNLILDVRTPEEYSQGHIPESLNIPLDYLEQHLAEIKDYQTVYIHCHMGGRAKQAYQILKEKGFSNLLWVTEGMASWSEKGYPIV